MFETETKTLLRCSLSSVINKCVEVSVKTCLPVVQCVNNKSNLMSSLVCASLGFSHTECLAETSSFSILLQRQESCCGRWQADSLIYVLSTRKYVPRHTTDVNLFLHSFDSWCQTDMGPHLWKWLHITVKPNFDVGNNLIFKQSKSRFDISDSPAGCGWV